MVSTFPLAQSCMYNPCKARKVVCQNAGVCVEGVCQCINNFEGDSCQDPVNKKFVSKYAVIRTTLYNNSVRQDQDDTLLVTAGKTNVDINIVSIRDTPIFQGFNAIVKGSELNIDTATYFNYVYYGNGSLDDQVITITMFGKEPTTLSTAKTTYVGYKFE